MDGYISCCNNSRLFGGNRRVTGLLVQALIATTAEQAKKITPTKETKASQIEKSEEKDVTAKPAALDWEAIFGKRSTETTRRPSFAKTKEIRREGEATLAWLTLPIWPF